MNWTTLKAKLRFKFKFWIQLTENLAKFTTEMDLLFTNTKDPGPTYFHPLKKFKCRCMEKIRQLNVLWHSKRIKYILVLYPWIYDLCTTIGYFHEMDFVFKTVIKTVVIAPDAAILSNYTSRILLCSLMLGER